MLCNQLKVHIYSYPLFRNLRKTTHAKLLANLCFALMGLYATFIVSTVSTGVPVLCGLASALLHYFFLAVFFWMAAEAIHLHRKLVTVFKPDIKWYLYIAMAICWGELVGAEGVCREYMPSCYTLFICCSSLIVLAVVPFFIVVVSFAPHYQNYIHPQL